MLQAFIRCYAELNELLPKERQYVSFSISLEPDTTIEELIKKIGIPSDLIDVILANNDSVHLSYRIQNSDRIAIYPVFESFDISTVSKLRGHPLRQPKFILDVHLGKLANHLRMLGFDTLYRNDYTDDILCTISINDKRILLSKDKSLIGDESLTHKYLVKGKEPRLQLIEVFDRFDLYSLAAPFTRCIECNSIIQLIEKHTILTRIPPKVQEWCNEYRWCSVCDRIYWKGSHYQHMEMFVQSILHR